VVRVWGRGFDPEQVRTAQGPGERVGIPGMRERITLLGGELTIESTEGNGTRICAVVPLPRL
jgi:signal transduction histidine kinase